MFLFTTEIKSFRLILSENYQREVEKLLLNIKNLIEEFLEKTKDQEKKKMDLKKTQERNRETEWLCELSSDEAEIATQAIENKDLSTLQKLYNKYNPKSE